MVSAALKPNESRLVLNIGRFDKNTVVEVGRHYLPAEDSAVCAATIGGRFIHCCDLVFGIVNASIMGCGFMLDLCIESKLGRPYTEPRTDKEGAGCLRGQWLLVIHAQFAP